ncbi:hypothetical protein Bca52824_019466 [Brassica carinata]|uniref:GRF-type domain-containing protein n=1 Tax=Brassica carinata TaxID=52824 RepID=A0A8X8AXF1_BRACI|nr:hypothetical protein Bca52824_019466 [Brassica carinata]
MSCTTSSSAMRSAEGSLFGVPTKCWCGKKVDLLVSKTNENPYRRFYRCEVALQRKHESHLYKWFEVAMAEEFEKVSDRIEELGVEVRLISEEIKCLGSKLSESLEKQKAAIDQIDECFRGRGTEVSGPSAGEGFGWSKTSLKTLVLVVCFAGGFSMLYKKVGG